MVCRQLVPEAGATFDFCNRDVFVSWIFGFPYRQADMVNLFHSRLMCYTSNIKKANLQPCNTVKVLSAADIEQMLQPQSDLVCVLAQHSYISSAEMKHGLFSPG